MKKIYISNVRHLDVCNNKVFQNICNGYFFSWLIILFDRCVLVSDLIMTWANFLTTINTEINIKQSVGVLIRKGSVTGVPGWGSVYSFCRVFPEKAEHLIELIETTRVSITLSFRFTYCRGTFNNVLRW